MQIVPDNIDLLRAQINVQGVEGSLIITDLDIVEDSLTLDRNSVSGRNIEVGNAETSELAFSLDNEDHRFDSFRFEGAEATVTLFSESGSIPAGVYIIDSPPKRETQMRITALDNMSRFNRLYDTQLAYPATLLQILQDACSKCGVTLYTTAFMHDDYVVSERPEDDNLTYHNIVAMVAELAGSNAWMDWNGQLRLTWYGDVQPAEIEISEDDRYGIETAENDIRITGLVLRQGESESLIGSDEYALIIEDNLLLQDGAETVMQALYAKIGGFVYRPFSTQIDARPELWPGDTIGKLWTDGGTLTTSIITSHLFQLNGRSRISAAGETKQIASQVKPAPFTARQKNILQVVAKQEAEQQVTTMEQAVLNLNQLMTNSWGFHDTTISDPVTGAKTYYMHDQSTLETSQVIYVMTGSGFAWTDQGWNSGSPVWQYGTTADGNAVLKVLTAYGINADWVRTGELRSQNDYSWINLDDGKFSFGNGRLSWNGSILEVLGKLNAPVEYENGKKFNTTYGNRIYFYEDDELSGTIEPTYAVSGDFSKRTLDITCLYNASLLGFGIRNADSSIDRKYILNNDTDYLGQTQRHIFYNDMKINGNVICTGNFTTNYQVVTPRVVLSVPNKIAFGGTASDIYVGASGLPLTVYATVLRPSSDASIYLGRSNLRWQALYAVTGTIQTSGLKDKENIKPLKNKDISNIKPLAVKDTVGESEVYKEDFLDLLDTIADKECTYNYKTKEKKIHQSAIQLGVIADEISDHKAYKYIGVKETLEDGTVNHGLQSLPIAMLAIQGYGYLRDKIAVLENELKELKGNKK